LLCGVRTFLSRFYSTAITRLAQSARLDNCNKNVEQLQFLFELFVFD
jgi:hypothetical protein